MTYRTTSTRQKKPRFRFISEIIDELKKVVWLTRQEATYLTALVLIITIIVGIFLGTVDFGFTRLVNKVLLGR